MALQVRNGLDLVQTAIINALLHPVSTDPSTPTDGQIWYRTDTDRMRVRANGVTQDLAFMTDVTGGAITGNLWDAQSYIKAIADNTPVVQVVGDSEFVGRPAGGNIGVITATQALAILATVDGAGSGLDADLLDGLQGSSYALQSALDAAIQGLSYKDSVRAATTANITLSGAQTIDGVSVIAGDRVLVKNQSTASGNGIYVAAAGAWARATDADSATEILGATVFVEEGTTLGDTSWILQTNAPITLGTTSLAFAQFGAGQVYTAGSGLTLSTNQFSISAGAVTDSMLASTFTKKFAQTIGDGSTTAIAVTHSLGTRDITWSVQNASTFEMVLCDVVATSTTVATFTFAVAPTTNQFRVTIVG